MGGEYLFFAVILADYVQNICEAVVVVIRSFDVRTKKCLRNGPRRVVLVKCVDKAA